MGVGEKHTSNDLPDFSNSSILRATSQLCETIGSGSLANSSRSAMLLSSRKWHVETKSQMHATV